MARSRSSIPPLTIRPVGGHEGWTLRPPGAWRAAVEGGTSDADGSRSDDLAAGRVLELRSLDRTNRVLWPLDEHGCAFPRVDLALQPAAGLPAEARAELLLMEPCGPVHPRIVQARDWGPITAAQAARAQRDAVAETRRAIETTVETAAREERAGAVLEALRESASFLAAFLKACVRHRIDFQHTHCTRCSWLAPSLADAIGDGAIPNDALHWLVIERLRSRRDRLRASQNEAWLAAIARYRHDTRRELRQP